MSRISGVGREAVTFINVIAELLLRFGNKIIDIEQRKCYYSVKYKYV